MTRRLVLAVVLLAVLSACSGVGNPGTTSGYVSGDGTTTLVDAGARKPAPVLSGTDLDGKPLSTADFKGQVLVINLWGSWCGPCRREAAALATVSAQYADRGVQFIGILTRDNAAAARAFNRAHDIDYPSFLNSTGRLELQFVDSLPAQAIPTTWIIDSRGRVALRKIDEISASILADLLDEVLDGS